MPHLFKTRSCLAQLVDTVLRRTKVLKRTAFLAPPVTTAWEEQPSLDHVMPPSSAQSVNRQLTASLTPTHSVPLLEACVLLGTSAPPAQMLPFLAKSVLGKRMWVKKPVTHALLVVTAMRWELIKRSLISRERNVLRATTAQAVRLYLTLRIQLEPLTSLELCAPLVTTVQRAPQQSSNA